MHVGWSPFLVLMHCNVVTYFTCCSLPTPFLHPNDIPPDITACITTSLIPRPKMYDRSHPAMKAASVAYELEWLGNPAQLFANASFCLAWPRFLSLRTTRLSGVQLCIKSPRCTLSKKCSSHFNTLECAYLFVFHEFFEALQSSHSAKTGAGVIYGK